MSEMPWYIPDWPLPPGVSALSTTRQGGFSQGAFRGFNLGLHVGDSPEAVRANRAQLRTVLPVEPSWLNQVHGVQVQELFPGQTFLSPPDADAAFTRSVGAVCAVQTADCLPVLFCGDHGAVVAAAHAGWRGLLNGVLEQTVAAMHCPTSGITAWIGPAIGPSAFEVGEDVRTAFAEQDAAQLASFRFFCKSSDSGSAKYHADLFGLARNRLRALGVSSIHGGDVCTFSNPDRYFSYRRDGATGRMASLIWRQ